jgi:hypothetical protein
MYMGPLTLALQLGSNVVNAVVIKSTPGFASVNIGHLTLLWCTRPRLAWLVVVLIPWQAREAMYFGVAASNLVAEIVLQLISSYYIGKATNYARRQKFYVQGSTARLAEVPRGSNATTLYAGALLWLIVTFFALLACVTAIFGVDKRIAAFGKRLRASAWKSRRRVISVRARRRKIASSPADNCLECDPDWQRHDGGQRQGHCIHQARMIEWLSTAEQQWNRVKQYLSTDKEQYARLQKLIRKQEKKSRRAAKMHEQHELPGTLRDEHAALQNLWLETPGEMEQQAHTAHIVADESRRQYAVFVVHARGRQQRAQAELQDLRSRSGNRLDRSQYGALLTRKQDLKQNLVRYNRDLQAASTKLNHLNFITKQLSAVEKQWKQLARESGQELEQVSMDPAVDRLRTFAWVTVIGMFGCWVAQWVWWVGFIGTMGDNYCPPKLKEMGVVWTVFSAVGALFGSNGV